jgi:hypothetical protein
MPEKSTNEMARSIETREAGEQLVWTKVFEPRVGENTLSFFLRSETATTLSTDDLSLIQEKKIHAFLVREDLSGFQHLYPEATREGWTLRARFREGGAYHLYLVYQPIGERHATLHTAFIVPGLGMTKVLPSMSTSSTVIVDGVTARIAFLPPVITTGTSTKLTFTLEQRGQVVQEIGPLLGAFGHVTILQQGRPDRYIRTQALTDRQPEDGRLSFETIFPERGIYMAYAEFNIAGALKTFPFVIEVKERVSPTTPPQK